PTAIQHFAEPLRLLNTGDIPDPPVSILLGGRIGEHEAILAVGSKVAVRALANLNEQFPRRDVPHLKRFVANPDRLTVRGHPLDRSAPSGAAKVADLAPRHRVIDAELAWSVPAVCQDLLTPR